MKVSYSRGALKQLDEIFSYIAHNSPAAATRLTERIERLARLLGQYPLMGRITSKQDIRIFGVPNYPYVIFYRIIAERDEIRILRIRHTARRPMRAYR